VSYTIRSVSITNIKGIAHLKFEPGTLSVIRGQNGTGKTSVITALRAVFDGGFDPTWVRDGEKKGTVEIVLDPTGHRIVTTLTRKGDKGEGETKVFSADGEQVPKPRTFVEQLAAGFAYDPVAFIEAKDKERGKFIQDFAQVEVSQDEIFEAVKEEWWHHHYDPRASAFTNIEAVRKAAYDRRTEVNRKTRNLNGTIDTMRGGVSALNEDGAAIVAIEKEHAESVTAISADLAGRISQAMAEAHAERQASEAKRTADVALHEKEFQRRIQELNAWDREERNRIELEHNANVQAVNKALTAANEEIHAELDPQLEAAKFAHAAAKKKLEEYNKAAGARQQMELLEEEVRQLAGEEWKLTRAIERLEELRKAKLSEIPIEGLELRDGSVFVDGLPFDALNTARQIEVALQIASTRPGALPFILIDNAEHLDGHKWEQFKEIAVNSGFQIVAARVSTEDAELAMECVS